MGVREHRVLDLHQALRNCTVLLLCPVWAIAESKTSRALDKIHAAEAAMIATVGEA
jgi:hypothetical protein